MNVPRRFKDITNIIPAVTRPEIEMLYIISINKYEEYTNKFKKKIKPSIYVKQILKVKYIKNYHFIKNHFSNIEHLLSAIKKYGKYTPSNISTIQRLIKYKEIRL